MKRILITISIIMAAVSCSNKNPFFSEWDTPYGIPDFGQIKEEHYIPAIEEGIRQQEAEIQAIIDKDGEAAPAEAEAEAPVEA